MFSLFKTLYITEHKLIYIYIPLLSMYQGLINALLYSLNLDLELSTDEFICFAVLHFVLIFFSENLPLINT